MSEFGMTATPNRNKDVENGGEAESDEFFEISSPVFSVFLG